MPSTNKQDKPTEKSLLRFRLPMKRYHLIRVTLLFLALPLFPQTRDVTKERILFLAEMFKMKGTEKVKTGKAVGIYLAETFAYGGGNDRLIVAEYLSYKAGDIAFKDNSMDSPYIKNVDLEFKVSRDQTSITTLQRDSSGKIIPVTKASARDNTRIFDIIYGDTPGEYGVLKFTNGPLIYAISGFRNSNRDEYFLGVYNTKSNKEIGKWSLKLISDKLFRIEDIDDAAEIRFQLKDLSRIKGGSRIY